MTFLFSEYSLLLVYVIVSLFLAVFIFFASFLLANQSPYPEKVSPYECGFAPFDDARNEFDVRFYLVAILFLVFDLEASFLFPWSTCLGKISLGAYWVMFDFFLELFVGFFYVWFVGALDWELVVGWKAFWLCFRLQI
jgi:NADH-quinone oxidoreductase subunit A